MGDDTGTIITVVGLVLSATSLALVVSSVGIRGRRRRGMVTMEQYEIQGRGVRLGEIFELVNAAASSFAADGLVAVAIVWNFGHVFLHCDL